jgi:hypothetical protein
MSEVGSQTIIGDNKVNTLSVTLLTLGVLIFGAAMVLLPYAARRMGETGRAVRKSVTLSPPHPVTLPGLVHSFLAYARRLNRYPELGGYVHDTHMSQFLPFSLFSHSAGTWTATVASNVWYARRSAADAAATTRIPVLLPSNSSGNKGAYLTSIDIFYRVATAALDALQADLYKMTLPANGALQTVAAVTTTYDAGHDSAAERITVDEHTLTLTLTTPVWVDNDEELFVEVVVDNAATSLLDFFGARANFTLRL